MTSTKKSDKATAPVIVWFRNDLRVADNRALDAAAESGRPVVPLFVLEDAEDAIPLGGAQRWWLHHSLAALSKSLEELGAPLILRRGDPLAILKEIADETGADTVFWNRRYTPTLTKRDAEIKSDLRAAGWTVESHEGPLLHEPTRLKTGSGGPYRVYTPFWRAFSETPPPRPPLDAPDSLIAHDGDTASDELVDWSLLPTKPDWSGGIADEWTPGEDGAAERLERFLDEAIDGYGDARDCPDGETTSKLSPHLAFGEITPFQIWEATEERRGDAPSSDMTKFRKELVWREFSWHLLVNFPDLPTANFNEDFDAFPWREPGEDLTAWQKGRTGYPIVDAGMRQLWQTGWMHNRVRMIVASFLIKHLLIDWRHGESWFRDTLVDADPASNAASWQWVAGSGADAAPYFRIFNPILQGEKFDPDGAYVRHFVPELEALPDKYLHKPWDAPESVLSKAGVKLGDTYPRPLVEHAGARERAMVAYKDMKGKAA
ncbi:deoxyribodipyrimidine photo-lyase [Oricola sp.]|uniref:cryptochrome/photolyase family protein n=1 Tax=Oricola sp. TaxID=1979950 RepID=UPI0025E2BC43|nr:deoxyribodipyrimidine photo-lyase [Oricola sp.]MCI5073813.1 DNA photolyase family protein [Oricola sp.]